MTSQENIINTDPFQFIEDDLKSTRAKERFLKRSTAVQVAKIITFFLGHNSASFSAEPVYGPTGISSLKSRGVQGLEQDSDILRFLESETGKQFISAFHQRILKSIKKAL